MEAADLFNKRDYPAALTIFRKLVVKNPDNFKLHETMAYAYLHMKDLGNAEKEYSIALKLAIKENPAIRPPRTFQDLVNDAGDQKQLEKEYVQIMSAQPSREVLNGSLTAVNLGIVYMARGEYRKAEELLTRYRDRFAAAIS